MVRFIIWLNIILVLISILLGVLSLNGIFHEKDVLPMAIGASFIIIIFLSLFVKWRNFFKYRIIGFVLMILSSIWLVHSHFNIYSMQIETNSRVNALTLLKGKKAPKLTHISRINLASNSSMEELIKNNELTILNFWATWCPPCLKEMPLLESFNEEYKDQGVNIIGFTDLIKSSKKLDPQKEIINIKSVLEKLNINYPILIDDSKDVRLNYGVDVLPATILIDNNGIILDYQIGVDGALKIMLQVRKKLLFD